MKIVVDVQGLQTGSRYRGIGRYIRNHVKALIRCGTNHRFILLLNQGLGGDISAIRNEFEAVSPGNIEVLTWTPVGDVSLVNPSNAWRHRASQIIRESVIASVEPDLVYVTSLFEGYGDQSVHSIGLLGSFSVTATLLYDLIPLFRSESYLDGHWEYKSYYHDRLEHLTRSDIILSISESVAEDAAVVLDIEKNRVTTIYAACDPHFRKLSEAELNRSLVLSEFDISGNFFMYTGGYDERKNLGILVDAFSLLSSELIDQFQMVFVGHMSAEFENSLRQKAQENGLPTDRLLFLDYVDDRQLVSLYNLCSLFIFPSLQEGFGLPPLEAMACGAPTIAADIPVLGEVLNMPCALFDPLSPPQLAEKICQVLGDSQLRMSMIEDGLARARYFNWDRFAETTMKEFECVVSSRPDRSGCKISVVEALTRAQHLLAQYDSVGKDCEEYIAGKNFISLNLKGC